MYKQKSVLRNKSQFSKVLVIDLEIKDMFSDVIRLLDSGALGRA